MKRPEPDTLIDDPRIVGYAGVILTSARLWQGMFIPECEPERIEYAKRMASEPMSAAGLDAQDPLRLANALASAVADIHQFGRNADIGALLAAISELLGAKYFVIRARDAEEGDGTVTSVEPIMAVSKRAARDQFDALPEVQILKTMTFIEAHQNRNRTKQ